MDDLCSVAGCGRSRFGLGFCNAHWQRHKLGKDLTKPLIVRRRYAPGESCKVDNCNERIASHGMCSLHYKRSRKGTALDKPKLNRARPWENGGRWITSDGYIRIPVPPGTLGASKHKRGGNMVTMLEHRYVMQKHLGRPLLRSETVHHKDGNRSNNILGNLELKPGRHGKGIALIDGVEACVEYLERYANLDLYERMVLAAIREKATTGRLDKRINQPQRHQKKVITQ